jgi:hypothetical protein
MRPFEVNLATAATLRPTLRRLIPFAALAVIALLVAACSGGDADPTPTSSGPVATATSTPTIAPAPPTPTP